MNPHTFAMRDCANYQTKDGSCLGILVECLRQPEEPTRAKPLERCLLAGKTLRTCPDCGGPLAKRQRYCPKCTQKRRLATYRQRRLKNKLAAPQLSGF